MSSRKTRFLVPLSVSFAGKLERLRAQEFSHLVRSSCTQEKFYYSALLSLIQGQNRAIDALAS